MPELPVCPLCQSAEPVVKVSQVYIAGITKPAERSEQDRLSLLAVFNKPVNSSADIREAARLFGPPAGRSQMARPVHPDLYLAVLAMAAVVFLINSFAVQRSLFWGILGVAVGFGLVYFFTRRKVVAKFRQVQAATAQENLAVDRAMGVWMKLYYCAEDGCVFDPEDGEAVQLEEMPRYLALQVARRADG